MCISLLTACIEKIGPNAGGDDSPVDAGSINNHDSGGGGITPSEKFVRWMKCMRFSDFDNANFATAWNIGAQNNQNCVTCHENGAEGFIVTTNEQKFFDVISTNKYYALEFFTYTSVDPFKVGANQTAMTGVSNGLDPHREHPKFNPFPGLAASADFAKQTQLRYEAAGGNCVAP